MTYRIAALLLCWGASGAALGGSGEERITAYLEGLDSLQARFEQTLYDEELNRLEEAEGRLYLERPGRFRWDYTLPYEQVIVSDGKTLWMYDSELAQVTKKRLDTAIANTPTMLLSSEQPLAQHFKISEVRDGSGDVWVELRPKSPDATFSNIRVQFEGESLQAMELVDNFGQITHLEFSDVQRNPDLDDGLFDFSPPEGVDVIGDSAAVEGSAGQ